VGIFKEGKEYQLIQSQQDVGEEVLQKEGFARKTKRDENSYVPSVKSIKKYQPEDPMHSVAI